MNVIKQLKLVMLMMFVATLALGSQLGQGLWAKREAHESHHMFPRVQSVQRVWRNEPSHSQMNSHVGSWSPNGLPNL
jgi:hypothetical protein